ncbi:basic leucine zipper 43-like [Senna tora]|uniref:Basic leucine zipper 43-like n=1 Tax=Senna tora TaxID=362788 RepID=A0A834W6X0_9FABA|nr:basic leucine zipper 43-like [Senna tora]
MEGNKAEKLGGVPYTTFTQAQHLQFACATQKPIFTTSLLNMQTMEGHEGHGHVLPHLDPSQSLHYIPLHYSQLHLPRSLTQIPDYKSSPNTSHDCNNNEAVAALDDQKKRRMLSNRESARRSRMRKKQQIEALQCQVNYLQTMNDQLSRKIINLLECNQQILQQNVQLKEKVSSLQVALSDLFVPLPHVEQTNHIHNGPIAEPSQAYPSVTKPAWLHAIKSPINVKESGLHPELCINSNNSIASRPCPLIPYPAIITFHDASSFSFTLSKRLRDSSMEPLFAYMSIKMITVNKPPERPLWQSHELDFHSKAFDGMSQGLH